MKYHRRLHRLPTFSILTGFLLFILLAACRPAVFDPPRLETQTAQAELAPTAVQTPLFLEAPTPTADPVNAIISPPTPVGAVPNQSLTLWVNDTSAAHTQLFDEMAREFSDATNIQLEVVQVSPELLPELVDTAVISDTLPDLILHPLEYTAGPVELGTVIILGTLHGLRQSDRDPRTRGTRRWTGV